MKKKLHILGLVCILATVIVPTVAFATMPVSVNIPDVTSMTITSVDNYQNYIELGDVLSVVNYNVGYSAAKLPTQTIDQTMIGRFMNSTGTELAAVAPYPYFNEGYQHGIFSFYWPAATAPTFTQPDSVQFNGNPLVDWLGNTATTAQGSYQSITAPGVATDQTAASNSAAANDINPLSTAVALNAASYWGLSSPFSLITYNVGTAGSWVGSVTYEYWNSAVWEPLSGVTDNTGGFTVIGTNNISFTLPTDWAQTTINGVGPLFYVRARVSAFTSVAVVPLGTQSWLNGNATAPGTSSGTMNWHPTSTVAATSTVLGIAVINWAQTLANQWNVALTVQGANGTLLSNYGFAYFSNAILGIATACPQIFTSSSQTIQPVERTSFDTTAATTMSTLWPWASASNSAGWLARGFMFWGVLLAAVGITLKVSGRVDIAVVVTLPCIAIGAEIGAISLGTAVIIGVMCILILGVTLILQRGNT